MNSTEKRNPNTMHIDQMSTQKMINIMQQENENAVKAVGAVTDKISAAVDAIYERMSKGGRLFYIGCGTSGRLGVLDASECPPTFGVDKNLVVGIIAGGDYALRNAVEGVEDDEKQGAEDLKKHLVTELDTLVGISAAGAAPYVLGAMKFASQNKMLTVGISSNKESQVDNISDISIVADTGAEVISGSTRMKAGTSQKLILNMLSTSVMIKLGTVYENMMVNLKPMNNKLKDRMIRIVCEISNADNITAEKTLIENDWNIKSAVQAIRGQKI